MVGAALAAAAVLAGCGGTAARHSAGPSAPPATQAAAPATSAPPSPEARICVRFRSVLPHILKAVARKDGSALLRYAVKLGRWSHPLFTAYDFSLADYLGAASGKLIATASPVGALYARQDAADLGKVNGYCKYDAGIPMGY